MSRTATARRHAGPTRAGFTLAEMVVVVIIIAILAAMVVPRFADATEAARTSAARSTLAAVRSALAAYRAEAVIAGTAVFPSAAELDEPGVVLSEPIPANPFTGVGGVQAVSRAQAESRTVTGEQSFGWNYFANTDPAQGSVVAIFYANSGEVSTHAEGGTAVPASDL